MTPFCLVLDLDDTLILERDYIRSGFHAVGDWLAENHGIQGGGAMAWQLFEAGHRGRIFDDLLESYGLPAVSRQVREMLTVYREHRPRICLLPDARDLLEFCRGRTRLALISDGPLESQQRKVEALGLERLIERVVLTGRWGGGFGKPHRRAFELIERLFGMPSSRMVYVADNPAKDFFAPRSMGWRTIRVRRPLGIYSELEAPPGGGPDEVLSSLVPVMNYLAGST